MTRLVICKKCWKIFFTNIKGRSSFQCKQRNCRSRDTITLSARFINEYGLDFVVELIARGKPLDTVKYRTIADIPPIIVRRWFNRSYRNREPELNIKWLMAPNFNLSKNDIYAILNILYDHSGYGEGVRGRMPEYKEDPKPPEISEEKESGTPGRPPLKLTSGQIEYFHRKHREWLENQRIQAEYDPRAMNKKLTVSIVAEWFRSSKKSETIRYRWAAELLEKHIPKD